MPAAGRRCCLSAASWPARPRGFHDRGSLMAGVFTVLVFTLMLAFASPAAAEWRAGNPTVTAAAQDPRIAAVLATVNAIDAAVMSDDHAAFADALADDLAVNNPQNTISRVEQTRQLNAAGRISYARYERV